MDTDQEKVDLTKNNLSNFRQSDVQKNSNIFFQCFESLFQQKDWENKRPRSQNYFPKTHFFSITKYFLLFFLICCTI